MVREGKHDGINEGLTHAANDGRSSERLTQQLAELLVVTGGKASMNCVPDNTEHMMT